MNTEKPANYDWSFDIEYSNMRYRYEWKEHFHNGNSLGYSGSVLNLTNKESTDNDLTENNIWIEKAVSNAAAAFRYVQLRDDFFNSQNTLTDFEKKILDLYEKNKDGMYLGQATNNGLLYVQDIAKILDITFQFAIKEVGLMVEKGLIGTQGMILIDHEDYLQSFSLAEKRNGHKRFSSSDFGWWSCRACNQNGDDWTNPSDFPCI